MNRESVPLLQRDANSGLPLLFATLCIVDIFGVFPIIALPRAIVQCGESFPPIVIIIPLVTPLFCLIRMYICRKDCTGSLWCSSSSLCKFIRPFCWESRGSSPAPWTRRSRGRIGILSLWTMAKNSLYSKKRQN